MKPHATCPWSLAVRQRASTRWPAFWFVLSLTLMHASGCATMKLPLFKTEEYAKATAKNPVAQVVCIWQPAEGRGLDELPARGFAGQIVFLTANSPTPVEVEGNVTIYLFDDHGTPEERSRPLHVFRFVDGSWRTHLKPTAWGPTYQLFIPYIRKGSHRAACSLAVQVDPPKGRRVDVSDGEHRVAWDRGGTGGWSVVVFARAPAFPCGPSACKRPGHSRRRVTRCPGIRTIAVVFGANQPAPHRSPTTEIREFFPFRMILAVRACRRCARVKCARVG